MGNYEMTSIKAAQRSPPFFNNIYKKVKINVKERLCIEFNLITIQ